MSQLKFVVSRDVHCKYLRPNYDQIAAYRRTGTMIGCKFKLQWTTRKFPVKFIVDIGMNKKYTLVSKKSIEYNTKQLELQSKIVMFQNVNKHWRAHLERLFGEVTWRGLLESMHVGPPTDSRRTTFWPPTDPWWSPDGSSMDLSYSE